MFRRAKIYFSSVEWNRNDDADNFHLRSNDIKNQTKSENSLFSARSIDFDYPMDTKFETGRWVRIPITPNRIANRLKVKLYFAEFVEWILLSEVKFESGKLFFKYKLNLFILN